MVAKLWSEKKKMSQTDTSGQLTQEQGQVLVRLARQTIAERLGMVEVSSKNISAAMLSDPVFQEKRGTFVTLKINKQLRGCIGCLTPSETIIEGIKRNALNAAFQDPRFSQLSAPELEQAEIEISILTNPQKLEYADGYDLVQKLRPGIDGVILGHGTARATFLPQVWEQLPGTEEFLAHLCRKAGFVPDAWQSGRLEVSTYQVQYFHERS
jgi:AmmeMemoRadiSam system protein A